MLPKQPDDIIVSEEMIDNETWNTCPICHNSWKDIPAIRGLLHRTRVCQRCKEIYVNE